jgi:hypothetical protein
MSKFSSALYEASRKISKRVTSLRKKNPRRLPWKDQTDWIYGRYFLFTYPYALFYLIGGIVGFVRKGSWWCLGFSGGSGLVMLVLAIAHSIDYYRGVSIEAIYIALPFGKFPRKLLKIVLSKYILK